MDDSNNKRTSFISIIGNMFSTVYKLVSDVCHLASAETQLAKQSLANMIWLSFVIGALVTSTWLGLLGLLISVFYTYLQLSLVTSFLIVFVINLSLILATLAFFFKLKGNLYFRATRKHLTGSKKIFKDTYRERLTAKN